MEAKGISIAGCTVVSCNYYSTTEIRSYEVNQVPGLLFALKPLPVFEPVLQYIGVNTVSQSSFGNAVEIEPILLVLFSGNVLYGIKV